MSKGFYKSKGWSSQKGFDYMAQQRLADELLSIRTGKKKTKRKGAERGLVMPKKFYVVLRGHMSGIYTRWEDCKRQVDGYPYPSFRKFTNEGAALLSLDQGRWYPDVPTEFPEKKKPVPFKGVG